MESWDSDFFEFERVDLHSDSATGKSTASIEQFFLERFIDFLYDCDGFRIL